MGARAGVAKPGKVNSNAIKKWMEECKEDVGNAICDDGLHVVCLVGMGSYKSGLGKLLPHWLERYHKSGLASKGLLLYLVRDIPGTWDVYSFGSYGVTISTSNVKVLVKPIRLLIVTYRKTSLFGK